MGVKKNADVWHAYRLNLENDQIIYDPTANNIKTALLSLVHCSDNTFAILSEAGDGLTYIQTATNPDGTLILDYQEGSTEHHYNATDPIGQPSDKVIAAFQLYVKGDDSWKKMFSWEKLDFNTPCPIQQFLHRLTAAFSRLR